MPLYRDDLAAADMLEAEAAPRRRNPRPSTTPSSCARAASSSRSRTSRQSSRWRAREIAAPRRLRGRVRRVRPGRAALGEASPTAFRSIASSEAIDGPARARRPGRARDRRSRQEVTAQVVDLDARITNLRASEDALVAIMDRAGRIDDVLVGPAAPRGRAPSDRAADRAARRPCRPAPRSRRSRRSWTTPVAAVAVAQEGWDFATRGRQPPWPRRSRRCRASRAWPSGSRSSCCRSSACRCSSRSARSSSMRRRTSLRRLAADRCLGAPRVGRRRPVIMPAARGSASPTLGAAASSSHARSPAQPERAPCDPR